MSGEQYCSCLCFHACACWTRWEGHRLPWSDLRDFWLANAVHPTPPIMFSFPSPFLLPSHKSSLLSQVCAPQSVSANLLLSCLSHRHVLQPCTLQSSPPPSCWELLAPVGLEVSICWTSHTSASGPGSLGACSICHTHAVSSSCYQSAAVPDVLLLSVHTPMAISTNRAPSWFQCLTYKILLVADIKKSRDMLHLPKIHLDGTLKEEKGMFRRKAHRCIMALLISHN